MLDLFFFSYSLHFYVWCILFSKKIDKYDHIPAHPMIPFPFKWNILSLVIGQVLIGINNKPNNGIVS